MGGVDSFQLLAAVFRRHNLAMSPELGMRQQ